MSLSSREVRRRAGLTERRLDYWTRTGVLKPVNAVAGSGVPWRWNGHELVAASAVADLLDHGLHRNYGRPVVARLAQAARVADPGHGRWLVVHERYVAQADDHAAAIAAGPRILVELRFPDA